MARSKKGKGITIKFTGTPEQNLKNFNILASALTGKSVDVSTTQKEAIDEQTR